MKFRAIASVYLIFSYYIISTGVLVNGQPGDIASLATMIRDIPTKYRKYAVTGNRDRFE